MVDLPVDELARRWWEYHRRSSGTRAERKALSIGEPPEVLDAHEFVDDTVQSGGRDALDLLVAINDAAPPTDDGVTVGCGPLEDLLNEHADELIDDIDRLARRSPSFAQALSHVWLSHGATTRATKDRLAAWMKIEE